MTKNKTHNQNTYIVDAPSTVVPVLGKKIIHTITRIFDQIEFALKPTFSYARTQSPTHPHAPGVRPLRPAFVVGECIESLKKRE